MLTPDILQRCMPRAPRAACETWAAPLWAAAVEFGQDEPNRLAAALASIANESGQLTVFEEASYINTDYDYAYNQVFGARMPPRDVWEGWKTGGRKHFDQCMYNWLYDDRRPGNPKLGNVNDGDGYNRRGLGPLQITGGGNQKAASKACGVDFYANPDLLLDPVQGSRAAMAYLKINGITDPAVDGSERGFLESVRRSNPGLPQKTFREHHLQRWHEVRRGLGITGGGVDVAAMQRALMAAGFDLPQYGADGDLGLETRTALQRFQRARGLPITGSPDSATVKALGIAA
jgi:putative chitinase